MNTIIILISYGNSLIKDILISNQVYKKEKRVKENQMKKVTQC